MKLYQDRFYCIQLKEAENILEFTWEENHPEVTYESFIEACCNFIGYGFEFNTRQILIDTKNFTYMPPPEFHEWQKTVHHDRYRKIGVSKVAYVMNTEHVEFMKNSPVKEEGFHTDYFDDTSKAVNWLSD
ncbi:hypothetical protein FNH22_07980 [Fulvivirga sp. M361]|uniref:hypothetical protein n=1 Tax=Fulvivirga sp. M361 TaxID=2594266 RepID=UPI00117A0D29|nr:hypothetical protein [Fulvivirga sp. M361]TRX59983.1 hypothetical protein FNH22_07980 [Fulvivirga sp. M361]